MPSKGKKNLEQGVIMASEGVKTPSEV